MDNVKLTFKNNTRGKKMNTSGKQAIVLEVYCNRKRKKIPTGVLVEDKFWDSQKECVKKNTQIDYVLLNNNLIEFKAKYQVFIDEMNRKHNGFQMDYFDYFDNDINSFHCFIDYMEHEIERLKLSNLSKSTTGAYKKALDKLKLFRKTIPFELFNQKLAEDFFSFLRTVRIKDKPLQHNTIKNTHKLINVFLNRAINDKLIKHEDNPFKNIKIGWKQSFVVYIDIDELRSIENFIPDTHRMEVVRDTFLFSCYTGLAYADYSKLSFEDVIIENGQYFIQSKRQKNDAIIALQLNRLFQIKGSDESKPVIILKKYMEKQENFKSLPPNKRRFFIKSNQELNRELKILAKECNIKKKIDTHTGRHTFGTLMSNHFNKQIPIVSKLMSHSTIQQTMKYIVINDKSIRETLDNTNWEY